MKYSPLTWQNITFSRAVEVKLYAAEHVHWCVLEDALDVQQRFFRVNVCRGTKKSLPSMFKIVNNHVSF